MLVFAAVVNVMEHTRLREKNASVHITMATFIERKLRR
jgi:hypothetical protein